MNHDQRIEAGFANVNELARLLGVHHWFVRKAIRTKAIPAPSLVLAGQTRKHFTAQQVAAIVAKYAAKNENTNNTTADQ